MGSPLPVDILPRAERDVGDAIERYIDEAGPEVASRFAAVLAEALDLLAGNPGIGSLRHASVVTLPGMRCWLLRPWPYLIFYVERERQLDVVRVLHGARDIPASLAEPGPASA